VRRRAASYLLALSIGLVGGAVSAQNINMATVAAAQDFRWGVQAYNSGLFNKSILYFEKSLSEMPGDSRTKEWLGRAYYRSGFISDALDEWNNLLSTGKGSALLQNRVATVSFRRGVGPQPSAESYHYVVARSIQGVGPSYTLFLRPSAVTARPDGGFYLASFATNEILQLDANGGLVRSIRGGLSGFDHPFDVVAPGNGYLYISEYGANRIARCTPEGGKVFRFGSAGVGPGQLLGPQFLASDGKGYIYVSDVGNQRISKFDYNGKFVLSFGQPAGSFGGLQTPAGIAVYDGKVFVADNGAKDIVVFDTSGNYLTTLLAGRLDGPEGLSLYGPHGDLIISDTSRVLLYNVDNDVLRVLNDLSGTGKNILKTVEDANGDLLAADFDASKVFVLSQYSAMYAGLSVQIDRVYSDQFPQVSIDVSVKSRLGSPLTGLDLRNFVITEGSYPVGNPKLIFRGTQGDAELSILVDRSAAMASRKQDIRNAVTGILSGLRGRGTFRVVSAGPNPVVEAGPSTPVDSAARAAADNGTYSSGWRFDLGLRMAISELIPRQGKSAVVFVTQGSLGDSAFRQYPLGDLLSYMQNNGIQFYCVFLDQDARPSEKLLYLCRETGGKSYYLYQPQGVGLIADDVLSSPDGHYVLSYTSPSQSNFGNNYIPVEVEAHLYARSGRDESGYFAPLQF